MCGGDQGSMLSLRQCLGSVLASSPRPRSASVLLPLHSCKYWYVITSLPFSECYQYEYSQTKQERKYIWLRDIGGGMTVGGEVPCKPLTVNPSRPHYYDIYRLLPPTYRDRSQVQCTRYRQYQCNGVSMLC